MIIGDLDLKRAAADPAYLAHVMTLFAPEDWARVSVAIDEIRAQQRRAEAAIDDGKRRRGRARALARTG